MPTADVIGGQAAGFQPVVQLVAPGQVGLLVATVDGVERPGRVAEAAIAGLGTQVGLVQQDILEGAAEAQQMPGAVYRLTKGLGENLAGGIEQILAPQAGNRMRLAGVQSEGLLHVRAH